MKLQVNYCVSQLPNLDWEDSSQYSFCPTNTYPEHIHRYIPTHPALFYSHYNYLVLAQWRLFCRVISKGCFLIGHIKDYIWCLQKLLHHETIPRPKDSWKKKDRESFPHPNKTPQVFILSCFLRSVLMSRERLSCIGQVKVNLESVPELAFICWIKGQP